jgi:small-conductance mechanosensitive channel
MNAILNFLTEMYEQGIVPVIICIAIAFGIATKTYSFFLQKAQHHLPKQKDIPETLFKKELFLLIMAVSSWFLLFLCSELYELRGVSKPIIYIAGQVSMYLSFIILLYYTYSLHRKVSLFTFWIFFSVLTIAFVSSLEIGPAIVKILEKYYFTVHSYKISLYLVLKEILIVCIALWLIDTISLVFRSYLKSIKDIEGNTKELFSKIVEIILYSIAVFTIMNSLGIDLTSLTVISGAIGVGLAVGLQKISANFISGIIILMEKTIKVGDLVELPNGVLGHVKQLAARYTLLEGKDGREIMIPNADFITSQITNFTYSSNKFCITIVVTINYDSDADQALKIMTEAAKTHPKCLVDENISCYISNLTEQGVQLTLNFWIGNVLEGTYYTKGEVMMTILDKFKKYKIKFSTSD